MAYMKRERLFEIAFKVFKQDVRKDCEIHPALAGNLRAVLKHRATELGVSLTEATNFAEIFIDEMRAEEFAKLDAGKGQFTYVKNQQL